MYVRGTLLRCEVTCITLWHVWHDLFTCIAVCCNQLQCMHDVYVRGTLLRYQVPCFTLWHVRHDLFTRLLHVWHDSFMCVAVCCSVSQRIHVRTQRLLEMSLAGPVDLGPGKDTPKTVDLGPAPNTLETIDLGPGKTPKTVDLGPAENTLKTVDLGNPVCHYCCHTRVSHVRATSSFFVVFPVSTID